MKISQLHPLQSNILVIIPACNEELNIKKVIDNLRLQAPDADYVIINDCSCDKTRAVCHENGFNFIDLPINLGIGGAVQTGYRYALELGYEIAIQHDGDGQHDPAFIKDIVALIMSGKADIVIGSRFITYKGFQSSGIRRLGIYFLSNLIRLWYGVRVKDVTSGFRGVNREYIALYADDYAHDYPEPEAIITGARHGANIIEVPVLMHERNEGQSSIKAWKSIFYMIKVSIAIMIYRPRVIRRLR